jgi:hypothetical protein
MDLFSLLGVLCIILFVFHSLRAYLFAFELVELNQKVIYILQMLNFVDFLELIN